MPAISNITIKKADGTTDVTYTVVASAAGDTTPAVFRNNTVGTTLAQRPMLTVKSRSNGPGTARRIDCSFSWPLVAQDAGGNTVVNGRMTAMASVLIPQNQDPAVIKEQAYQFGNLIGSSLLKASFDEGYAPRS